MTLQTTEIAMQHHPLACAYYSVINLFKLRAAQPPTFGELVAEVLTQRKSDSLLFGRRSGASPLDGVSELEQLQLLYKFNFPAFGAVGIIPYALHNDPRAVLLPLLLSGAHLLIGFKWRRHDNGEIIQHSVVLEGFEDRGYVVIDSGQGHSEGSLIELEPNPSPAELNFMARMAEKHPHGVRRVLPFCGVGDSRTSRPLGLNPYFLIAYPTDEGARRALRAAGGVDGFINKIADGMEVARANVS
jgi:hypothetical protein